MPTTPEAESQCVAGRPRIFGIYLACFFRFSS